jgi:hypothetical protein
MTRLTRTRSPSPNCRKGIEIVDVYKYKASRERSEVPVHLDRARQFEDRQAA